MQFRLTIKMGNAAMQANEDLAAALRDVAKRLDVLPGASRGTVMDVNGNTVGEWTISTRGGHARG